MSYSIKIQLLDDDSIIEEIETEANSIEQAQKCTDALANTMDDFYLNWEN